MHHAREERAPGAGLAPDEEGHGGEPRVDGAQHVLELELAEGAGEARRERVAEPPRGGSSWRRRRAAPWIRRRSSTPSAGTSHSAGRASNRRSASIRSRGSTRSSTQRAAGSRSARRWANSSSASKSPATPSSTTRGGRRLPEGRVVRSAEQRLVARAGEPAQRARAAARRGERSRDLPLNCSTVVPSEATSGAHARRRWTAIRVPTAAALSRAGRLFAHPGARAPESRLGAPADAHPPPARRKVSAGKVAKRYHRLPGSGGLCDPDPARGRVYSRGDRRRTGGPPPQLVRASLRRRDRGGPHLLLAARHRGRRGHREAAAEHRPADLRRRTPHGVPARDVRVRALGRLAPARVVLPPRLPVLQHRAAEPALRAPRRGAGGRAARARRRGARGVRGGRRAGVVGLRRARAPARARHRWASSPSSGGCASASRAPSGGACAARRRSADRDRALRDPDREPHGDGLHGLGHHPPPALAHGGDLRRAERGAPRGRPAWWRRSSASTPTSSAPSARRRSRRRRPSRRRWRRRARATPPPSRPSTSPSAGAARGSSTGARGRRRSWPTPCATCSARADLDDDEALALALDPARNRYRLDTLNVSFHAPVMRALDHAHYTFRKKLSHTADSQDQRHRMVPGSRPLLTRTVPDRVDVIEPELVARDPACHALYVEDARGARGTRARGSRPSASPRSTRSTCCRTRSRCASRNRARCSTCSTSGRCARA